MAGGPPGGTMLNAPGGSLLCTGGSASAGGLCSLSIGALVPGIWREVFPGGDSCEGPEGGLRTGAIMLKAPGGSFFGFTEGSMTLTGVF